MHFEILCCALSYEPSLLMFHRFFPSYSEWGLRLLLKLCASRTKLRAYLEELLVVLGVSQDWVDSDFEPIFCVDREEMSALDYILLDDPSHVEIEQREIPVGGPSIVRRTEHVRTTGDLESVPLQLIMDGSSAKKLHAPVRMSTRGTVSTSAISQSSYPISIDSVDEDDVSVVASVNRIKLVKKEVVPEASGGACDASSVKISAVLKKLNESKRNVPERSTKALEVGSSEVKASKPVSKKERGKLHFSSFMFVSNCNG
ncbi:hypothetical protein Hanom_Chr06g00564171 [Helianthus anomalus]